MREIRLLMAFLLAFGATTLAGLAGYHAIPAWVRVVAGLPALLIKSLGI